MYLLQTPPDNVVYAFFFVSAIVGIWIFYMIIKGAVQAGTQNVRDQIFIQNRLLIEQLKKEGVTDERIQELINKEIPR